MHRWFAQPMSTSTDPLLQCTMCPHARHDCEAQRPCVIQSFCQLLACMRSLLARCRHHSTTCTCTCMFTCTSADHMQVAKLLVSSPHAGARGLLHRGARRGRQTAHLPGSVPNERAAGLRERGRLPAGAALSCPKPAAAMMLELQEPGWACSARASPPLQLRRGPCLHRRRR